MTYFSLHCDSILALNYRQTFNYASSSIVKPNILFIIFSPYGLLVYNNRWDWFVLPLILQSPSTLKNSPMSTTSKPPSAVGSTSWKILLVTHRSHKQSLYFLSWTDTEGRTWLNWQLSLSHSSSEGIAVSLPLSINISLQWRASSLL